MNDLEILFKAYIAANNGDNMAKWKLIEHYMDYINYSSEGNEDLKHTIIVDLLDLFSKLNDRFEKFFKEIN